MLLKLTRIKITIRLNNTSSASYYFANSCTWRVFSVSPPNDAKWLAYPLIRTNG